MDKARSLHVDAVIFDLEDAVAPDEKAAARTILIDELQKGGFGERRQIVRINGLETLWGKDDLAALMDVGPQVILVPKVDSAAQIAEISKQLELSATCRQTDLWAMMETPRGVLHALEIAQAPRMAGFVLGTNDLAKDLNITAGADRLPLQMALQTCLMAARAADILCIDGVYNAFKDDVGLRAECAQGRALGMDGKTLIHPAQIAVCHEIFSPTAQEADLARRQILAFEAAMADGKGVAVVDGKIVENLHVASAHKILAMAEAIEQAERG